MSYHEALAEALNQLSPEQLLARRFLYARERMQTAIGDPDLPSRTYARWTHEFADAFADWHFGDTAMAPVAFHDDAAQAIKSSMEAITRTEYRVKNRDIRQLIADHAAEGADFVSATSYALLDLLDMERPIVVSPDPAELAHIPVSIELVGLPTSMRPNIVAA